ncbi:MAG TPA: hypothetical protein VFC46_01965, partial [Humisphaera sp.]|nr:hypothetical protein [Humisphaera sp.]
GRIASHIGPVVAETEMDAINAIQQILYMPGNEVSQSTFIDVPCGQLASWLMSNGFTILRKLTRMCLGTGSLSLSNPKIFAACSFELG